MQKVFIANASDLETRIYNRERAGGYKRLVIDDSVDSMDAIEIKTEGTDLVVSKVTYVENADEEYVILCKEFGLVGLDIDFRSDISVIFLDGGYMLVTLRKGGLVINLDDKLLMPNLGVSRIPNVNTEEILWIKADFILSYSKYWGTAGRFMYDMEIFLNIGGDYKNQMWNSKLLPYPDQHIDISLGKIAQWEQLQQTKQEAKAARSFVDGLLSQHDEDFEYESDFDFGDDSEDSEDDDSDDWDDY